MKYALIFVLIIFSKVTNAQRLEKIDKVDLMNLFKEDINFWDGIVFRNNGVAISANTLIKYTKLMKQNILTM